jgi:hypothetical protein
MTERSLEPAAVNLVKALTVLALEPRDQVAHLEAHGTDVDELALTLDDLVPFVNRLAEVGALSRRDVEAIHVVHDALSQVSARNDVALWSGAALGRSSEWLAVRLAAKRFFIESS